MAIINVPKFYFTRRAKGLAGLPDDAERWRQQEPRDQQLEYWLNNHAHSGGGASSLPIPTFNLPGVVFVSASGRWEGRTANYNVVGGVARLVTAGSTTTTAVIKLNGATIITFSLVSSDDRDEQSISPELLTAETDYLTAEVTAAGTGAADLVIEVDLELA